LITRVSKVPDRLAVFGEDPAYAATVGQTAGESATVIGVRNLLECVADLLHILEIPHLPQYRY
jgi:hypothetical protein